MTIKKDDFDKNTVDKFMHKNFIALDESITVEEALNEIRKIPDDGRVIYFYTKDSKDKLSGIIPARSLLITGPEKKLNAISRKDIVHVTTKTTMLEVANLFVDYKYLSLPVVDKNNKIIGVVDLRPFTKKEIDISDKVLLNEIFQTIGIRASEIIRAGVFKSYAYRFPWLIFTISSGLICAFLSSMFEQTLVHVIIIAFFITLVLALGESISIQSMAIASQIIRVYETIHMKRYLRLLAKEILVGLMLGLSCGIITSFISLLWKWHILSSLVIGLSIILSIICAIFIGISVPIFLHSAKKDPKIASGPLVLALTDICTILIYLSLSSLLLQ